MLKRSQQGSLPIVALAVFGVLAISAAVMSLRVNNPSNTSAVLAESSTEFTVAGSSAIANQDGDSLTLGATKAWYGTAQSTSKSYLGINFTGGQIPAGAQVKSARLELTAVGSWISVSSTIYGDASKKGDFSSSSKPADRTLTSSSKSYSDNVKWDANATYSLDVTGPVQELVGSNGASNIGILLKGTGGQWGRKEIYGNPSTGKSPKLVIVFVTGTATSSPTASASPTATATTRPSSSPATGGGASGGTPAATASPVVTQSPTPTATASTMPTMSMSPAPVPTSSTETIYGAVSADILGTCTSAVHDRYVVRGPDGVLYRTWHPQTVPVDANNPNGAKCTFAHEHGDNPATSNIFQGAVPFDYVPHLAGMDEPHVGFKCFVQNKGIVNDEGRVALHDAYYCFHMGTGGAARFSTRFHSLDFHVLTSGGARMDLMGLADVGNVGTICSDPRQSRTVMGYGCKLDSAYEIWADALEIKNQGNTIATAIVSTAVFDPITVMDPADPTKLVYTWDPLALANIFKFGDDRSGYRGCARESYTGPLVWYNQRGSQTYYTDVYGNVTNGGPIKQTISQVNTDNAGPTLFGGLVMTNNGGNPQTQFKYHKDQCAPGLGLKN